MYQGGFSSFVYICVQLCTNLLRKYCSKYCKESHSSESDEVVLVSQTASSNSSTSTSATPASSASSLAKKTAGAGAPTEKKPPKIHKSKCFSFSFRKSGNAYHTCLFDGCNTDVKSEPSRLESHAATHGKEWLNKYRVNTKDPTLSDFQVGVPLTKDQIEESAREVDLVGGTKENLFRRIALFIVVMRFSFNLCSSGWFRLR